MSGGFTDHFSPVSASYAAFRPRYPAALFDWLGSLAPARSLAWDCAAGSGQASVGLASVFDRVIATDASAAQIGAATAHERVSYRVAPAEHSGLAAASVDLVTVAQALHWLPLDAFYEEVRRVLRPAGALAVWSYGRMEIDDAASNELVQDFYSTTVGPYWPPERVHVESGYRALPFPFREVPVPSCSIRVQWRLQQLLGYLSSWSATARYIKAQSRDPVPGLAATLTPHWGGPDAQRTISWPLAIRAGRP
jgi:SAM-dependent methyltransferase